VISGNNQYAGGVPGDGFSDVKYLESHDENRLVWSVETIGAPEAQAIGGIQKAHLGALALMTAVGIPMLYNGQEIGSAEYRPADPTIYKIDWNSGDSQLRSAYRNLIRLRLRHPALATENIFFQWREGLIDQEEKTMVYWRGPTGSAGDATLVVALNFDHNDRSWTIPFPAAGTWYRFWPVTGAKQRITVPAEGLALTLEASSGIVWLKDDGVTGVPD
jgi:glycosidase